MVHIDPVAFPPSTPVVNVARCEGRSGAGPNVEAEAILTPSRARSSFRKLDCISSSRGGCPTGEGGRGERCGEVSKPWLQHLCTLLRLHRLNPSGEGQLRLSAGIDGLNSD